MKIKLLKPVTIEGKTYPCNCVIDIYQPEWEAMIADGTGVAVPDGTMARLAAYDAPGCVPPQVQVLIGGFMTANAKFIDVPLNEDGFIKIDSNSPNKGFTIQQTNT